MATTITANGINFPDGSASAPSIGGTDTNTGLFTGSDIVGFATGGLERLRITSDGKVGLGITNPARKLHLHQGDSDANYLTFTNTTTGVTASNGFTIGIDSSENAILNNYGAKNIEILCNGAERLRITSDGKIGIGTASPDALLTVSSATPQIKSIDTDGTNDYSTFQNSSGISVYNAVDNNSNGQHLFQTGGTERVRIDSTGRIGIGTNNTAKNAHSFLNVHRATSDANYMYFTNSTTGETGGDGFTIGLDGDEKALFWNRENTDMRFGTNGTERLTIAAAGDVTLQTGNLVIGTAGKGIDFSADGNASGADDERLNDYEEGDWTPTPIITHQGGSGSLSSIQNQYGRYVKIGREVRVWFYFEFTAANITNCNVGVSGLPFTISNDAQWTNGFHGGIARRGLVGGETYICEGMYKNNTQIQVLRKYNNYGFTDTTQSVGGTACYLVD